MYQQEFDCPIPQGISCTSVTDLESLIVETNRGPDVLVIPNQASNNCKYLNKKNASTEKVEKPRVWICQELINDDCERQGHYLYITDPCIGDIK